MEINISCISCESLSFTRNSKMLVKSRMLLKKQKREFINKGFAEAKTFWGIMLPLTVTQKSYDKI